ncbi:endonuclease Q family protein [Bacillus tianshenii]|uniref:endonuclease Q family protein n=1 Tax=Sutcliffiella tianshenii TaxID=1463404 RepID=UPI001CD6025E|nr:endonuclease Q family protein [Bacillus tianshenii]MCA1321691.1 endonuclease Q family protein [Bacillus tianshenii]
MQDFFADLHIHLGSTTSGKPVKITASRKMTIEAVIEEARIRKGLDMIGVIDCHVPEVLVQLGKWVKDGSAHEKPGGGLQFGETTLILGTELEVHDDNCKGLIHVLCYFPTRETMIEFSRWLGERLKNITLSTQRVYEKAVGIQEKVRDLGGLFIPAHVFTPFKSLYGKGVERSLKEVFDPGLIDAVELGLSADTAMASALSELDRYSFVSNSDAHSVGKIAREYQKIRMMEPTFKELKAALYERDNRGISANYGLDPHLGKYYRTACIECLRVIEGVGTVVENCPDCGHARLTKGVSVRIEEIRDQAHSLRARPPYIHQVPLDFIPGLGPKTMLKLRAVFGTEMKILHEATFEALSEVVGEKVAHLIVRARNGELNFHSGGGGRFGRVK